MKNGFDRKAATIAIAGAVALGGWAVGASAAAAAPAPGAYTIVNVGSGLCLGVPGAGTSDGVQFAQSGCGATGQTWNLVAAGGGFQLKAVHSGKCAGVQGASTSAGKAVQQETCSGTSSQTWNLTTSGDVNAAGNQLHRYNSAAGSAVTGRGGLQPSGGSVKRQPPRARSRARQEAA